MNFGESPSVSGKRPGSKEKIKVAIVDTSDSVESKVRDVADARLTESREKQKGPAGFLRRIWKHNLFNAYYRQREIQSARGEIMRTGNLYIADNLDAAAHQETMEAIVKQFTSEYEEAIHTEAGESREVLGSSPEEMEIRSHIQKLIQEYASQDLDDEEVRASFAEERNRIFSFIQGTPQDMVHAGLHYADNLLEVVKEVQRNIEHGERLEDLDLDFEIIIGKARSGVRTEAQFDTVDKLIDKIQSTKIGSLINETTLAAGLSIAYSLIPAVTRQFGKIVPVVGTAAISAAYAGLREKKRLEEERRQHARERAMRQRFSGDAPRREAMERFRYETKEANVLADTLEHCLYQEDEEGIQQLRQLSQTEFDEALAYLSDIESRINISDREKVDLISYSDETKITQERNRLDMLRARAKHDLKGLLTAEPALAKPTYALEGFATSQEINAYLASREYQDTAQEEERKKLLAHWLYEKRMQQGTALDDIEKEHGSFTPEAGEAYAKWDWYRAEDIMAAHQAVPSTGERPRLPNPESDFRTHLSSLTDVAARNLIHGEEGMEKRNALFNAMKRKEVAKTVGKTLLTGLLIGTTIQEAAAFFQEGHEGLVKDAVQGYHSPASGMTHLTPLAYLHRLVRGELPRLDVQHMHTDMLRGAQMRLPEGVHIAHNPDGTFRLLHDGKVLEGRIALDAHGHISPESQALLAKHDIRVGESYQSVQAVHQGPVTPQAYALHAQGMKEVHRPVWLDNNTPNVFDKNELGLWWGGEHGSGIDAQGRYVYNIAHMTNDGSYHGQFSAQAHELMQEGKLKLLLTISRDTQRHVFEIPINAEGNAVIDPHSEAGRLLFSKTGGHAHLLGQFAEVAQVMETHHGADTVHILATDVGQGLHAVEGPISAPHAVPVNTFDIPADYTVDPPPFIPLFGRRPLEPKNRMEDASYLYNGYNLEQSPEDMKDFKKNISPTLVRNPGATLDHYAEAETYFKRQDKAYREEVQMQAKSMEAMRPECRLSICIPVAGHQEGENIYRTLEHYLNQTADKKLFEIVLFVNTPENDEKGNPVTGDKTLAEIVRFRKDHPELPVRVMEKTLPSNELAIGHIRKFLNDAALARHHARGKGVPDLIMVSNDADSKGVSPRYIENFIQKFDEMESCDAMLGELDWDPQAFRRNPLLHVGLYLAKFIQVQERRKKAGLASSGGNFAFRSSIYAGIGGYASSKTIGEDVNLGSRIALARKGGFGHQQPIAFAGANSRLYTSARHAESVMEAGLAPVQAWERGFGAFDDEVRKTAWENRGKEISFDNKEEVEQFVKDLQRVINKTIIAIGLQGARNTHLERAMGWLGIKYIVQGNNQVKITNADKLMEGLRKYQESGVDVYKRKIAA